MCQIGQCPVTFPADEAADGPTADAGDGGLSCDANPQIIQASSYDQTCTADSDCTGITEGNSCNPCSLSCVNASINVHALPQYTLDNANIVGAAGAGRRAPAVAAARRMRAAAAARANGDTHPGLPMSSWGTTLATPRLRVPMALTPSRFPLSCLSRRPVERGRVNLRRFRTGCRLPLHIPPTQHGPKSPPPQLPGA